MHTHLALIRVEKEDSVHRPATGDVVKKLKYLFDNERFLFEFSQYFSFSQIQYYLVLSPMESKFNSI